MSTVTLNDVLAARDMRVQRQSEMIKKYQTTLVCLTMNIAGPVKVSPEIAYAYQVGVTRILEGLTTVGFALAAKEELSSPAGHCLLLAVDAPAEEVKRLCVSLENLDDLGRLFDMDVIASDGRKLTRSEERCCLICGLPGRGCASRRIHPVEELQRKTSQIIQDYRTQAESRQIASLAVQSMQDEVCATPKPGLVDCLDSGSHRDMDIFTFNASSAALYPYFQACYLAGAQDRQLPAREAFDHLQTLGIEAERVMRRATAGVNTHKGAIYTLGVLCGAAGRTDEHALEPWLEACAALTAHRRGDGVRAEVADGLPSVREIGLPALETARASGQSLNDQCLTVLLHLLASVRDTNMLSRGGELAAKTSRDQAQALLRLVSSGDKQNGIREIMKKLNVDYQKRNLSPGGCADLLAATLLVDRWIRASL